MEKIENIEKIEKMALTDNKLAILYTTMGSLKEAEILARKLLSERYAACINIIPGMQAMYLAEGAIKTSVECTVIFKTTLEALPILEQWLLDNHPYDTPAILTWDAASSEGFSQYVHNSVQIINN